MMPVPMVRRIGGQNFEGRYFIVAVPDNWTENDPLPPPRPEDLWFDRLSDFTAALDCPWIRTPLRHREWRDLRHPDGSKGRTAPQAPPPGGAERGS